MNVLYNKEIVEYVADQLSANYSYIEKDYYAVQILSKLASFESLGHKIVFSGGTSLSKGYGLIQRFSEDLDFEIVNSKEISRSDRKHIRHDFLNAVKEIENLKVVEEYAENEGRKHTVMLEYPHIFPIPSNLRDNLKIEIFFEPMNVSTEERCINSFISLYSKQNMENAKILCNHPFNIMVDKFNALTWRIFDTTKPFDYSTMRHLHDLYAISTKYYEENKFKSRVLENFALKDKPRVSQEVEFADLVKETNKKLISDDQYKKGYEKFVDSMSYAPDDKRISFDIALKRYQELSKIFL